MDTVIALLVFSTVPQLVVPQVANDASFRAVVELVTEDSRIFSGESVRLRCSIPDPHRSTWTIQWFRGSKQLPQSTEYFTLWKAYVRDGGKYYCQGVRDTLVGNIKTLPSLPVEINVDGGWAILKVPPYPLLVGDNIKVACRVRGNPILEEVILYKDGVEVMRQTANPLFILTNLTLADQGQYSCRGSWDIERRTRSVISVETEVQVLEVVTQPHLEIVADDELVPATMMKLICHVEYNARAPAPAINYYFYKNNNRLGTATSENHDRFKRAPGYYSCKAKVPVLGISRISEPEIFGKVTGPKVMMPPYVQNPNPSLPRAAEPTAQPNHQQSNTEEHTQSTSPTGKPSQPVPSNLPSTVQSVTKNITLEAVSTSDGSGDME